MIAAHVSTMVLVNHGAEETCQVSTSRSILTSHPVSTSLVVIQVAGRWISLKSKVEENLTCLRRSLMIAAHVSTMVLVNHSAGETCQVSTSRLVLTIRSVSTSLIVIQVNRRLDFLVKPYKSFSAAKQL
jgi:ABC-type nitrate/sulfonate/bicarbonate transport system ATPase subunit